MIKHLLLMTFAPPLILLGEPMKVFWGMTPLMARSNLGRVWQRPIVQRLARMVTNPVLCWAASALTLIAWHVPTLFALGVRSEIGHTVEQAMFFGTGLLFWWPVIQPWPSASTEQRPSRPSRGAWPRLNDRPPEQEQCSSGPGSCSGGLSFSLGQAPRLGRDGRCSCTFFWRLCRATSFPDFSSSLTVSHTRCIFPLRGCLAFPFLEISSVRPQ